MRAHRPVDLFVAQKQNRETLGIARATGPQLDEQRFSRAVDWIYPESSAPAPEQLLRLASGKPHLGQVRTSIEQFSVLRNSG